MMSLREAPLRLRLFIYLAGPLTTLLVLAGWRERLAERSHAETRMEREQLVLLKSLDRDLNEMLEFGNPIHGSSLARRLRAFPGIKRFFLFEAEGTPIYEYRRADQSRVRLPDAPMDGTWFVQSELRLSRPVTQGSLTVGRSLVVTSSQPMLDALAMSQQRFLIQIAGILALAAGLAIFLSSLIADPLLRLQAFLTRVVDRNDYSQDLELEGAPEWVATGEGIRKLLQHIAERELRLIELADEAQAASRSKGRFLDNMGHELRTPIVSILGLSEELQEGDLNPAQTRCAAEKIHFSGEHLLGVLGDILDMSNIESGTAKMEPENFDPREELATVVRSFREQVQATGLKVITNPSQDLPAHLEGQRTYLNRILRILLSNSIKFTAQGEIVLSAECLSVDGRWMLQVTMTDSGIGIAAAEREAIFDAFHQADDSESRQYGGTGLGLPIARQLAELTGGTLTAEEPDGRGARLVLRMGIEPASITMPQKVAAPVQDNADRLQNVRVLIAEDVATNLMIATRKLQRIGAKVKGVANGRLAVDAALAARAEGKPFDVILMDIQMPVMGGFEAVAELRDNDYTGHIVALTAHALSGDREQCINAGCDDYATKPIQMEALLTAMQADRFVRR